MTLSELDDSLPNGLHDAYLDGITVCFVSGTAELKVKLLVSEVGEKARYQDAQIHLTGLESIVIDGPDQLGRAPGPLGFSSFNTSEEHFPGLSRFPESKKKLFHSLYVEDPWNSFIHVAAASAEIVWIADSK